MRNLCEESLNLLAWSVFRMNISQHENLKSRIPEVHFGCLRQNETLYFLNNLTHSFVFSLTFTIIYLNKSDWTEGVLRLLDRRQSHQILSFFYLFSLCSLCYFNIFIIKMMPFSTSRLKWCCSRSSRCCVKMLLVYYMICTSLTWHIFVFIDSICNIYIWRDIH